VTGAEIRALARLIDRMDYYRLLRIDAQAPLPKIRTAYHRARRQFHPDAYLRSEPVLRDAVDCIARRITEAYMVLRRSEKRAAYDKGLSEGKLRYRPESGNGASHESRVTRGRTPKGRRFFTLALAEERAGNLTKAVSHLKMALTFERDNEHFREKLEQLQPNRKR
jgi:DnaJ-class molecular chaperone